MSRQAIAAVLARDDLASGERLVALSLASFADRENRAWPGTPAAAGRSGLCRSRYLQAREKLVARGLVVVDQRATGRGRASILKLLFADVGPWWDGEVNVELCEAVLGYSSARGPARLLLAAMAAISDAEGTVRDLATEQLCAAAGVADRTYRRARTSLLESGGLVLVSGVGGRGNMNVWTIADPRLQAGERVRHTPRRITPPAGARPLLAAAARTEAGPSAVDGRATPVEKSGHGRTVDGPGRLSLTGVSSMKGGHDRTVSPHNRPPLTGVSDAKGGQAQTLFDLPAPATPAQTPAETPAPSARGGKEPQNPRTQDPPNPPAGGSPPHSVVIEQCYVTERGRRRRHPIRIDLDEVRRGLERPAPSDDADWERIRALLLAALGESTFSIWLEPLELIAIDGARTLVVAAPAATSSWITKRFGRLLSARADSVGRALRFAGEPERLAFGRNHERSCADGRTVQIKQKEVS
ncbi:MAG: DnaA N-terminal domain-containing protein [Solirubrobacteraceae bacterium]